jgi:hypothetical protein
VISDIDPVVGKKAGSDRFDRIYMAGDREKDDPLAIEREGV